MPNPTVFQVLLALARAPHEVLVVRWNWKSAVCSSVIRASLFAGINAVAGPGAAVRAAAVELSYRAVTSGFHGALTQVLSVAEPRWLATVFALVLLPLLGHVVELVVHWTAGTAVLGASVVGSVLLSVVSTLFNLYAMRRGALIVGDAAARPLLDDLRRLPALIGGFLLEPLRLWSR